MVFPGQDSRLHNKTLKRTRKFVVDGVEVSITTSKIISEDEKKDEEMRFLRQAGEGSLVVLTGAPSEGRAWHGSLARELSVYSMKDLSAGPGATTGLGGKRKLVLLEILYSPTHPSIYPPICPCFVHPSVYVPTHQVGGHVGGAPGS